MSKMQEAEIFMKLNPSGGLICTNMEPKKVVKSSPSEEQVTVAEPIWLNKQKSGSVIPAKRTRRSVKGMVFKYVAESMENVFRAPCLPSSPEALKSNKAESCIFKKGKSIYPHTS
ncbi:hypothetical protein ACB092_12G138500 [Castanea dentata]